MVGIRCPCVVGLMARIAISRCPCEDIVDVALGASHVHVRAGQWEWRLAVIERRARPRGGRVACGTRGREACRRMIRIRRAVVIRFMA